MYGPRGFGPGNRHSWRVLPTLHATLDQADTCLVQLISRRHETAAQTQELIRPPPLLILMSSPCNSSASCRRYTTTQILCFAICFTDYHPSSAETSGLSFKVPYPTSHMQTACPSTTGNLINSSIHDEHCA